MRKIAKLKKLKKLSKISEQSRLEQETKKKQEEDISQAFEKLGLRAEREVSDLSEFNKRQGKRQDWETGSQVSRSSSQMSTQRQNRMQENVLDHPKVLREAKCPIYRICLTGGPCAGKTTALTTLNQVLVQRGFRVYVVPEAATMLMKGGAFI